MTHLPFIAAAYALGLGVPAAFGILAWWRIGQARRRLIRTEVAGVLAIVALEASLLMQAA